MKLNKTDTKTLKKIVKNYYASKKKAVLTQLMADELKTKRLVTELIKDFTATKLSHLLVFSDDMLAPTALLKGLKSKAKQISLTKKAIKLRKKERLSLRKR